MELGADINKKNNDCKTSLLDVCFNGNENIVKYLVKHNTNVNKITSFLLH